MEAGGARRWGSGGVGKYRVSVSGDGNELIFVRQTLKYFKNDLCICI